MPIYRFQQMQQQQPQPQQQQQLQQQQQQQLQYTDPNAVAIKLEPGTTNVNMYGNAAPVAGYQQNVNATQISSTTNNGSNISNNNNITTEMDQEIEALLSQKDIVSSLAEDLLKQFGDDDIDIKQEVTDDPMCGLTGGAVQPTSTPIAVNATKLDDSMTMSPMQNGIADSTTTTTTTTTANTNINASDMPIKCEATSTSAKGSAANKSDETRNNEPVMRIENTYEPRRAQFTPDMDAKAIAESVK